MKGKMEKVWIENVIIDLFNNANSCLKSTFDYLISLVGSKKCEIYLFDPDLTNCQAFNIIKEQAFKFPYDNKNNGILYETMSQKEIKIINSDLYLPLWFDNVSSFGVLHFKNISTFSEDEDLKQTTKAFSAIIYSEAMGSVFESVHSAVLTAKKICVDYKTKQYVNHVVKDLDIRVNEKEFSIIYGSSGCGKTTLVNALGGMLKVSSGSILWKDKNIVGMNEQELTQYRRDAIGFVFQKYNLIDDLTVEENIRIAASLVKNPLSVKEVLKMVGLEDETKKYPSQLSGGQQQRVCIARALVKQASIIICDEPTGALDTENALQVVRLLQKLAKEQGTSVLMITHNQNFTVLADHCFIMKDGKIVDEFLQPFALSAYDLKTC